MKSIKMTGKSIKEPTGYRDSIAKEFPRRRFHDETVYVVRYNGVQLDGSTVVSIDRSKNGWED